MVVTRCPVLVLRTDVAVVTRCPVTALHTDVAVVTRCPVTALRTDVAVVTHCPFTALRTDIAVMMIVLSLHFGHHCTDVVPCLHRRQPVSVLLTSSPWCHMTSSLSWHCTALSSLSSCHHAPDVIFLMLLGIVIIILPDFAERNVI